MQPQDRGPCPQVSSIRSKSVRLETNSTAKFVKAHVLCRALLEKESSFSRLVSDSKRSEVQTFKSRWGQ